MAEAFGAKEKETVQKIPLLTINSGPRDKEGWEGRLKQVRESSQWAIAMRCMVLQRSPCKALPCFGRYRSQSPSEPFPIDAPHHHHQELHALIQYIQFNKASDSDWFTVNPPQVCVRGVTSC